MFNIQINKQTAFEIFSRATRTNPEVSISGFTFTLLGKNIRVREHGVMARNSELPVIDAVEAFRLLEARNQSTIPFQGFGNGQVLQIKNPETGEWVVINRPPFVPYGVHDQFLANYETPIKI